MSKKLTKHLCLACFAELSCRFRKQELLLGKIMTQVNELAAKLEQVNVQLGKAKEEIINQVNALQDALANVELPADAEVALNNLVGAAQALDDLNPDAPAPEPAPAPEEPVV